MDLLAGLLFLLGFGLLFLTFEPQARVVDDPRCVGGPDRVVEHDVESNRLVGASLTDAILQNRYIEKLSDQIQVMLVPSEGGGLTLDLGNLTPASGAPPSAPAAS